MTAKKRSRRQGGGRRRNKKKTQVPVVAVLIVLAIAAFTALKTPAGNDDCGYTPESASAFTDVVMPDTVKSHIVDYIGYRVSFNQKTHIPNWVAWELTREETEGKTPRYDKFATDQSVDGCAETYDYLYSGYDRGHMAPAADMKWSREAMEQSFFLTNICPQARELNTGAWRTLEEKCRQWAKADSAIVIIAGPVMTPAPHEYIGDNRVAVPRSFFKVILSPYAKPVRAIAFLMPNSRVAGGIQTAATTVDHIEELTGYDFFAALPDSIEERVESESDFPLWSRIKPKSKR